MSPADLFVKNPGTGGDRVIFEPIASLGGDNGDLVSIVINFEIMY